MRHSRLASSDKKGTMERKANVSRRRRLAVGAAVLAVLVVCTASVVAASTPAKSHGGLTVTKATNPSSTVPQPTYDKKCQSTAKSELAMDRCVAAQVAQLDRELTHALSVEASYLGHSGVTTTQSKWLAFRKSECTLEAQPYAGGSIRPLVYGECERGLLFNRVGEIRSVVDTLPK